MYCRKCGNPDQSPDTYCRSCGTFLHDPDKFQKKQVPPAQHVTANLVLSGMTVVISFVLAFLLCYFDFGWPDASVLTYATAGFLIAIGCWNIQTFYRSLLLKKHLNERKSWEEERSADLNDRVTTNRSLNEANFEDFQPASVTDRTTRDLVGEKQRSS